ncbi:MULTISPECIES: ABC transporter permease [unclassified Pseudoalteromonas]|uniref:ABC transporter permease n=1 Tax=unclassified Pseudoalteromonas TaxID=194690 RepID=UPI000C07906F|nr:MULTISPECIES: ABC transporter permease [unclassified Pseudoalteromonas]MDP2636343.1 ABC transporter permease [Pseudoalteromonas sp. 1_MG-2023]PHN88592.1 hypothetical protein CSC79_17275 [Pseudoalteromonas sp. 3D05]
MVTSSNEDHATKVAAVFESEEQANRGFETLSQDAQFEQSNINVIAPHDNNFGEKVEPEDKNIGKTLLKTHIVFGVIGLVVGLVISTAFLFIGVGFIQNFVFETYAGISTVTIFIALLVAGLMSIRPDHDPLINNVRKATSTGKWVLIVHTDSGEKTEKAETLLKPFATSISATL